MATSSAKTALLSEAGSAAISQASSGVKQQYDTYQSKQGHIDNKAEHSKLENVLDGVNDQGLRFWIHFLDKLSKVIIGVFTVVAVASAAATVIGFLGLFGFERIYFLNLCPFSHFFPNFCVSSFVDVGDIPVDGLRCDIGSVRRL